MSKTEHTRAKRRGVLPDDGHCKLFANNPLNPSNPCNPLEITHFVFLRGTDRPARNMGFSLIEILIVVVLIGMLAMIVVPEMLHSSEEARNSTLAGNIRAVRAQIEVYKMQHGDRGPHLDENGNPDTANFVARLTGKTDPTGKLNTSGACGPYLHQWPENEYCTANPGGVKFGKPARPLADGTTGWYYSTSTCLFSANAPSGGGAMVLGPEEVTALKIGGG